MKSLKRYSVWHIAPTQKELLKPLNQVLPNVLPPSIVFLWYRVEQLLAELQKQAAGALPSQYNELGDLVAIDGSLIDSALSMHWAEYRSNSKKAKLHFGFDLNHGIPRKLFLTEGKGAARPFVSKIIEPGQTGVLDRGYQAHHLFDQWQQDQCHFVCRIRKATKQDVLEEYQVLDKSPVFLDAEVLLGTPNVNQTEKPIRLVGYIVDGNSYWGPLTASIYRLNR